jgi:tetratricopeptide (TPR) repeat protein
MHAAGEDQLLEELMRLHTGRWMASVLVSSLLAITGSSLAQERSSSENHAGDAAACEGASSADTSIAACTRLLEQEIRETTRRQATMLTFRALARRSKGDLDGATADLSAAVGLVADFAPAYEARGDLLRSNNKCDLAIAEYDQVIKLVPGHVAAHVSRAACLIGTGEAARAVADLDQVIKLDESNAAGYALVAWSMKARVNVDKDDLDGAIASFDAVIKLDPKRAATYIDRGAVLSRKNENERALADYDKAIEFDAANADGSAAAAWTMKARVHAAQGDFDRAIADVGAAIRLEPSQAGLYLARAAIWDRKGDLDQALADHGRAIEIDPNNAVAYNSRGDLYQTRNEHARALENYGEAISRQPDYLVAYGNRALVRFYQGEFAKAADDFKRVADAQPNAYSALLLYLSLTRAGNANGARTELTKAAGKLKAGEWPYPVVELYLGRKAPQAVEAVAGKPDEKCEAQFYIGQWHLVRGARPLAAKALQAAADTCPKDFVEYRGALAELKRLAP